MADNYLEKKMEEYRSRSTTPQRQSSAATLNRLLLLNRSHRGYDQHRVVTVEELRRIVSVNTRIPSARNQQCLRYRLVTREEAHLVLPHIKLGGALPELHLPTEGTEPQAFIIVCSTIEENKWVDMDLGISAQSMLLKGTEMGLNGICIGAFNKAEVTAEFELPYEPVLVLAIGKGAENIQLTHVKEGESQTYYRKDGVHFVPKLGLEDLLL